VAALRRAVQPVYDQLQRDPQTRRYIQQITAMSNGVPAEPAPGCGNTAVPGVAAGQLDGVWRYTDTPADLQAIGAPQGDIVPENYGTFTMVVDRGRFAVTQENAQACTWSYGPFTVRGDRFEQLVTDGGGIAPTGAANKPGELFTFRWSRYRGVLTLYPVQGAVSPTPPKPWVMISTTPSARFLSTRCPPPTGALPP